MVRNIANMRTRFNLCFVLIALGGGAALLWGQAASPKDIFAQKLIDKTLAKHHPEVTYLGLHLIPPSGSQSIIAAATQRSKIGNKSSCSDLKIIQEGIPVLEMKGNSSSVLEPLHDDSGRTIGLAVIGLTFGVGQESQAARAGREVVQEIEQQIPSKAALFETSGSDAASSHVLHIQRVLLVSIDGFHALDLANFIKLKPNSTLGQLSRSGITYTQTSTSKPSDSFPGLLSMVTGGSPLSTGVWYEGSYARNLSPPGSHCQVVGTQVVWDGSIDKTPKTLDAGGGIDPAKLPLDPAKGCTPVYPHNYLRVNTIFDVVHSAGLGTAWIDKHPSYEMVNGPSDQGVDDLFTPELAGTRAAKDVSAAEAYDDIKVSALINEIHGKDHTGARAARVPAVFGMTFQAVSQGERLHGYSDASGAPGAALADAINHTDQSLGKVVSALKAEGLLGSTLIIITAKHGQSPIDRSKRKIIADTIIPRLINNMQKGLLALAYQDGDLASIWLTDESQTAKVAAMLNEPANQAEIGAERILFGESLRLAYGDPVKDKRTPDIIIVPVLGDIYADPGDKIVAAHGGFNTQDTNVALLVSNPGMGPEVIKTPVQTTQIAPTILAALGLNPQDLQAVRKEKTSVLPGLFNRTGSATEVLAVR